MLPNSRKVKTYFITLLKIIVGRVTYEKLRAFQYLGYWPNLKKPTTYNEKLMQMKLFRIPHNASLLSDKLAVRGFVKEMIGERYLNTLYFSGDLPDEIDFDALPEKFVIKTNNGCEGNIIVKEKADINIPNIKATIRTFLKQKFGYLTNESWYLGIKPKILIEEFMEAENGDVPDDYKFFCFHGVCKFIQVNKNRFSNHNILFYDENWIALPFGLSHYPHSVDVAKPENFEDMKEIAQKLSKGYDFVRVDLYSYKGLIKFGEMTFAPNAGWKPFNPPTYDAILGKMW